MCDAGGTPHLQQGTFSPCVCLHVNYHELCQVNSFYWPTRAGGTPQQKKRLNILLAHFKSNFRANYKSLECRTDIS